MSREQRREMVDRQHPGLSIVRQCALLGISRSSVYYRPREFSPKDLEAMKLIDQQYLATPFYGSRRTRAWLGRQSHSVNRKRVQRLMRTMGLQALYRRPRTSQPGQGHKVYPYLLSGMAIIRPNQVWAADITYIPMSRGFHYLVLPRKDGLVQPLRGGLETVQHIFVERLWRTVKYEGVYLKAYSNGREAKDGLEAYFHFYNTQRPHQALGYRTPAEVFSGDSVRSDEQSKERRWSPSRALVNLGKTAGPSLNIAPILSN